MFFLSAVDAQLFNLVIVAFVIIFVASILRYFKQPYIIAYILTGILMGQHGFGLITDEEMIKATGEVGLVLLMFFIGMEINLPTFIKNWRIPLLGTLFQILGTMPIMVFIGWLLNWELSTTIVLGFIVSLSSSAIVIKLLQDENASNTEVGQSVISILLMQDILIVPMLICTSFLGGTPPTSQEVLLQVVGGLLLVGTILWVLFTKEFSLPIDDRMKDDHEMQVFVGITFCFGCAVLTAFFGLSAALGAFVGGMLVHADRSTDWFHDSLHSFRVVFVAIFFISIGMLIDISFFFENWQTILLIIFPVYIGNHFINAAVIHYFGRNKKDSLYGGAMLAQIGELSFVLASSAFYTEIISDYEYQLTVIVISLTLLISPFWISGTRYIIGYKHEAV